jgi:hypothetical protein
MKVSVNKNANGQLKESMKIWMWTAVLIILGVVTRFIPHPPNFSALLAVALFAGFVLPMPLAVIVPVISAVLGDLFIGLHDLMWVVYLTLLPLAWMGRVLPQANAKGNGGIAIRKGKVFLGWGLMGVVASVIFFVTTNLAVWWTSGMYEHTQAGLISCFVLAIPFFHNSVLSTWLYLAALEGLRRLLKHNVEVGSNERVEVRAR